MISNLISEIIATVDSLSEKQWTNVTDGANQIIYLGEAKPGSSVDDPVWLIKRITTTPTGGSIYFANNAASYTSVWSNHLTLVYGG